LCASYRNHGGDELVNCACDAPASDNLQMAYVYVTEVLQQLAEHGLTPGPDTAPGVPRGALSDLYRYEIRRLRDRLLAGEFPQADYIGHVLALRRKYWLLSVPAQLWTR
jgi:hypothetical protein